MAGTDHIAVDESWSRISYTGTREALIAAGFLRDEWILPKPYKNARVATMLPDGREVRVFKRGPKLEVWLTFPEEEREARWAKISRKGLDERERYFAAFASENLRRDSERVRIARHLEALYPGARVADVTWQPQDDGRWQQNVTIEWALDAMVAAGLVTQGMLDHERDSRRGSRNCPNGDGFSLFTSDNGTARLTLYTGDAPRESERFSVTNAERELRRFTLGKRRKPARVAALPRRPHSHRIER